MELRINIDNGMVIGAAYKRASDMGGDMVPEAIVLHHTAAGSAQGSIRHLTNTDEVFVSAHFVINRDGGIVQIVPCNRVAYHAGRSRLGDREEYNLFSIGIELANWGPLVKDRKDRFVSWAGKVLEEREVFMPDPPVPCRVDMQADGWERCPDVQLRALTDLCRALVATYPGIREVVGHFEIAGFRGKCDPGPPAYAALDALKAQISAIPAPELACTEELEASAGEDAPQPQGAAEGLVEPEAPEPPASPAEPVFHVEHSESKEPSSPVEPEPPTAP